ncbi:MAG TPA: carbon-nitrogen hydrolase family protein [Myxococcales bacterium]|nr:carbon-nitrogen hydrolase family protein [Myxococcales bacterium]
MFLAAAVQMRSGNDRAANEARALSLLGEAADRGAALIGLPEMWEHIGPAREKHAFAGPVDGAQLGRIREFCAKRGVWCLAGSIAELAVEGRGSASARAEAEGRSIGDGRVYNTSALISPGGQIAATYRKLHLFDVDIPDGARYRESEQVAPGDAAPRAVETPLGIKIGLSVCYDLRFPELYRNLGADLITVPAAFTAYTGRAHWEVLLRARAIENQAFVLAPAQVGRIGPASENRFAWGHACIVDPWGEVLADAGGDEEGLAVASLHPARLSQVRRDLPALRHRRRDVL